MNIFDNEKFINEVKQRPAIWDVNCEEYSDRVMRKKRWDEIFDIFYGELEDLSDADRIELERNLQRRWKSLRDCYSRELNRAKGTKSKKRLPRTQYVYFNHLSFLKDYIVPRSTTTNIRLTDGSSSPEPEETTPFFSEPRLSSPEVPRAKKRAMTPDTSTNSVNKETLSVVHTSKEKSDRRHEEDGDRMFFLSLLSDFKKIPERQRISVKSELMQVINRAMIDFDTQESNYEDCKVDRECWMKQIKCEPL